MFAHQDERWLVDARQRLNDAVVELGEHPARRPGQAGGRAMGGDAHLLRTAQRGKAVALERLGAGNCHARVPAFASLGIVVAGPSVEQHQRVGALGIGDVEGERHVAAQRQSADHSAIDSLGVEDGGHIVDRLRLAVAGRILGRISLSVPAHVPDDQSVIGGQDVDLAGPHLRCGAVAVREQDGRPVTADLVVDADAVTVDSGHCEPPRVQWITSVAG